LPTKASRILCAQRPRNNRGKRKPKQRSRSRTLFSMSRRRRVKVDGADGNSRCSRESIGFKAESRTAAYLPGHYHLRSTTSSISLPVQQKKAGINRRLFRRRFHRWQRVPRPQLRPTFNRLKPGRDYYRKRPFSLMAISILVGDALASLRAIPPDSVHCVFTNPPYIGAGAVTARCRKSWGGNPDAGHCGGSIYSPPLRVREHLPATRRCGPGPGLALRDNATKDIGVLPALRRVARLARARAGLSTLC
jgi:hypothetical protein